MLHVKLSFLLTLVVLAHSVLAQKEPIKWGKIPDEDLRMTSYEKDPSAGAVILCDFGDIRFDFGPSGPLYRFVRHKRVKILNRSGFDQADVVITLYGEQKIRRLKAQIFTPDGTETKLDKKDFYEDKVTKHMRRHKFALPNVREGSVIEYTYEIESDDLFSLRDWYFQSDIPTRWSELRLSMIEWFYYATIQTGSHLLSVSENKSGTFNYQGFTALTDEFRWAAEHIPALQKEAYSGNLKDYLTKIQFQLKSIDLPFDYSRPIYDSWGKITESLIEDEYFSKQYLKKNHFKKILAAAEPVMEAAAGPLAKLQAAYDFVQHNVKWNDIYFFAVDEDLDQAFESGSAYSGELNLMILALLKEYGIPAYPVITSTRSHGKVIKYFPLIRQFNHTLVLARVDGKNYWIDAGDPLHPMGLPQINSLNLEGLMIREDDRSFEWIDITPGNSSNIMLVNATLAPDGQMTGDMTCSHKGYHAENRRKTLLDTDSERFWTNKLGGKYHEIKIDIAENEENGRTGEPYKEKLDLHIAGAAMVSGDMIYLSPVIHSEYAENPFKAENRLLPVEFPYPFTEQIITNITLPEGFSVAGIPESISLTLPDATGTFQFRVSQMAGRLQLISKLEIGKTFFLPEEYAALRDFFAIVEEKLEEQVVLKKKT